MSKVFLHFFPADRINFMTAFCDWFYDVMDRSRRDEWIGAMHVLGFWGGALVVVLRPDVVYRFGLYVQTCFQVRNPEYLIVQAAAFWALVVVPRRRRAVKR